MSKRTETRKKRQREKRKQQLTLIAIVAAFALILVAILIVPTLKSTGNIILPTALNRPQPIDNAMGDPAAPVKVEEFADFQCPACGRYAQTIEPRIINEYVAAGKVYYRFNPFSFLGQESFDAAQAAYCAMEQGKFWEYHDILFANQTGENIGDFSIERLQAFANKLKLDTNAFNSCLSSNKYREKLNEDKNAGLKLGVTSTPSFIVNGKLVHAGDLITTIEEELTKTGQP